MELYAGSINGLFKHCYLLVTRTASGMFRFAKFALSLPLCLAPSIRYTSRHWRRSRQSQKDPSIRPTHELSPWPSNPAKDSLDSSEVSSAETANAPRATVRKAQSSSPLKELHFLREIASKDGEKILVEIAKSSHYQDIVSLICRARVLGIDLMASSSRMEALRIASCIPAKFDCYCCEVQICQVRNLIKNQLDEWLDKCASRALQSTNAAMTLIFPFRQWKRTCKAVRCIAINAIVARSARTIRSIVHRYVGATVTRLALFIGAFVVTVANSTIKGFSRIARTERGWRSSISLGSS